MARMAIAIFTMALLPPLPACAQSVADFSGTWKMDPTRSESAHQAVPIGGERSELLRCVGHDVYLAAYAAFDLADASAERVWVDVPEHEQVDVAIAHLEFLTLFNHWGLIPRSLLRKELFPDLLESVIPECFYRE